MPSGFAGPMRLTSARQSVTLRPQQAWMDVTMRIVAAALLAAFVGLLLPPMAVAQAQTASSGVRTAQSVPTEGSAQQRRRVIRRVPIYPREEWRSPVYPQYYPGPNAVRDCTATLVQEYRPSGTVITPRMNSYWRRG
jgi:hypothetical protein